MGESMPKWFSEEEKAWIERRLLEQGQRLFSLYGLKKTNVDEIARAAGISKGSFYRFYDSKEALFMKVVEQVEGQVREQILAAVDLPGPTPRARLFAILKKAFAVFLETPLLRSFTGSDYDQIIRRIPAESFEGHLTNDMTFFESLIARCQRSGIPVQVPPRQIAGLLFPLVLGMLPQDDRGPTAFPGSVDMHLELIAAYCLGEVELQLQDTPDPRSEPAQGRER
jgi:AcrR family transcriptional regulator